MKLLVTLLIIILSFQLQAQSIRLMTFNIRVDFPADSLNSWNDRKFMIVDLISFYEPDIFGIQEGLPHQVKFLDSLLHEYEFIGQGRDGGTEGEYSAVFYKKDKFEVDSDSTIWLSETPSIPSIGWDAALNRIITMGVFKVRDTDSALLVLNTHFDHVGLTAKKESAKLIVETIKKMTDMNNFPVVLMGDLNAEPDSQVLQILLSKLTDSQNSAEKIIYGPDFTYNGFLPSINHKRRIDYLLINGLKVMKSATIDDQWQGKYPSDHFPVIADIKF